MALAFSRSMRRRSRGAGCSRVSAAERRAGGTIRRAHACRGRSTTDSSPFGREMGAPSITCRATRCSRRTWTNRPASARHARIRCSIFPNWTSSCTRPIPAGQRADSMTCSRTATSSFCRASRETESVQRRRLAALAANAEDAARGGEVNGGHAFNNVDVLTPARRRRLPIRYGFLNAGSASAPARGFHSSE